MVTAWLWPCSSLASCEDEHAFCAMPHACMHAAHVQSSCETVFLVAARLATEGPSHIDLVLKGTGAIVTQTDHD